MPKILINEIDNTTPGTPDGYSNYSVLIAGFQKEFSEAELLKAKQDLENYDKILEEIAAGDYNKVLPELDENAKTIRNREMRADLNGVYEFTSEQDFLDTIWPVAPNYQKDGLTISHHGNQMAYELLKQGYSVIYLPIKADTCAATLVDASTWEIFKDKANYDFRFVCHGLLESAVSDDTAFDGRIAELVDAIDVLNTEVLNNHEKLTEDTPKFEIESTSVFDDTDNRLEIAEGHNELYAELYTELTKETRVVAGLRAADGEYYDTCYSAVLGVLAELHELVAARKALLDTCLITAGTIDAANTNIADLAKYTARSVASIPGRGDCVALIELDENAYANAPTMRIKPETAIINAINAMHMDADTGKYCAMTIPSVVYNMTDAVVTVNGTKIEQPFNKNKKFPGAFHYLTCFMNALQSGFAEWYAAAGYTRGVSNYTIDYTTVTLGELAINTLEPRNYGSKPGDYLKFTCNVIANFRGSYYLWGNRTCHLLGDARGTEGDLVASHFLNIRQLCITIKKQLYIACRRFTFDPNSDTLWFNFVNAIKPTLEAMKADQGIRDYKILKVPTDKKATLKAKIRIVPIEAVEDFDLTVSLEDSFGETAAVVTE